MDTLGAVRFDSTISECRRALRSTPNISNANRGWRRARRTLRKLAGRLPKRFQLPSDVRQEPAISNATVTERFLAALELQHAAVRKQKQSVWHANHGSQV